MPVPDALRSNGGYIIPNPTKEIDMSADFGPFTQVLRPIQIENRTIYELKTYRTVSSPLEAARHWSADAPFYLKQDQGNIESSQKIVESMRTAEHRPRRFDVRAGLDDARTAAILTLIAIVLNWLAASLGRIVFRLVKRNRILAA